MENRHGDSDGSDIFWPGYVDATTNLILNLLFLLTILIVAVFMFALELGRATQFKTDNPPIASIEQDQVLSAQADLGYAEQEASSGETGSSQKAESLSEVDLVQENMTLRREIERLNTLLEQQVSEHDQGGGLVKTVEATIDVPKPRSGIDKMLASDAEVMVRFKHEAIAFTPEEHDQLVKSLQPIVSSGQPAIYVEVPAGFSEAKRLGYYRAMAVRNLLLEMDVPKENIDVSVVQGKTDANAAVVRVRSQ